MRDAGGGVSGLQDGREDGVPATRRPRDPATLVQGLRPLLRDVGEYSRVLLPSYRLREYQIGPARAIAESITGGLGRQFAVVFSRQA